MTIITELARSIFPELRQRLRWQAQRIARPRLTLLWRMTPLSDHWGADRGEPIDRHYIAQFLAAQQRDLRGRTLEVKDTRYTGQPGLPIDRRDVLDIDPNNPLATIVTDLTAADVIPADQFDCFVLTQTLQFIPDSRAAIAHAHRILRPGGVLLATVPAISRIDKRSGLANDYWRFTVASCTLLFGEVFGPDAIEVRSYGNSLSAIGFMAGLAAEELSTRAFASDDPYFPILIAIRARKVR